MQLQYMIHSVLILNVKSRHIMLVSKKHNFFLIDTWLPIIHEYLARPSHEYSSQCLYDCRYVIQYDRSRNSSTVLDVNMSL